MTQQQTGWIVFVAALGMMATLMSAEIRDLVSWNDIATPSFVGTLLAHFGAVVGAFVAGKLMPSRDR